MIDLKTIKEIRISEGSVTKITNSSGVVLWEVKDTGTTAQAPCYYVAENVSDLPQSLYQAEYAQIGIQKFLITDYHWNVNSKAVVEFEINSDTNEFGKYGRILAIEGEGTFSSNQSTWDVENTTWQTKPFGSTSWNRSTVVPNLNQKYVGEYAETGLTIDGTVITATTPSTSITANTSHYVCIGGYNTTDQTEYLDGKIYSVKIYESGTLVRDIVPLTNGLFYDKLSKKVYAAGAGGVCDTGGTSTLLVKNESKYDMAYITSEKRWYALNNKSQWEKSYDEYDAPNLDYTECANEAAMKALSCPYEGMKVKLTDTGKKYKFTYNSTTSQYEWDEITSRLDVDLNNQWVESTKTLDGYKVYMSNSNHNVNNGYASMKFKFEGMPDFKIWINSYAESSYDYTVAYNLDVDYPTSNPAYNSTGVKAHTRGNQKDPANGLTAFTEVDYANDGGEHFVVVTYRKDSSVNNNDDRGYVAIQIPAMKVTYVDGTEKTFNSLTTIKQDTDSNKANAKSIEFYDGVTIIDEQAFQSCTNLENVIFSNSLIKIGDYAFDYCPKLTNIILPNRLERLGLRAFAACGGLTSVEIGSGLTDIGERAFYSCTGLTSITLPSNVGHFSNYAFQYCSSLASVTIEKSDYKLAYNTYNADAFANISSSAKLYVPSNLLSQYQADTKYTNAFKGGIYAIPS